MPPRWPSSCRGRATSRMNDAVIVSTARTAIGKAFRGALNNTHGATMGGHVIAEAVRRAGIAPDAVDDVLLGCAWQEGATGSNIARQAALRAGLPVRSAGRDARSQVRVGPRTRSRSPPIASAAARPRSSSPAGSNRCRWCRTIATRFRAKDEWVLEHRSGVYATMIQTAENVAQRYAHRARRAGRVCAAKASAAPPRAGSRALRRRDRARST